MVRVYGLLSLLYFAFFLYVLLDVTLSEPASVRNLPKLLWVVIVVVVPLAGGIAWLVAGRPERAAIAPGSTRARDGSQGRTRKSRPRGPDDDPEFLRRLEERLDRMRDDEE